jgi:hypothetical protein
VERFILEAGHTIHRLQQDYGYDLQLTTYDEAGYMEPGIVYLQLKAAESLVLTGAHHVFDLDLRDYHLWIRELFPVILILFDVSRRRAYWLHVQAYFQQASTR